KKFHNLLGGFVVVGGHVYAGSTPAFAQAAPTCLELKTGAVAWQKPGVAQGACSVLAADGHVYFRFADGQVVLVEATPQEYRETWCTTWGAGTAASSSPRPASTGPARWASNWTPNWSGLPARPLRKASWKGWPRFGRGICSRRTCARRRWWRCTCCRS